MVEHLVIDLKQALDVTFESAPTWDMSLINVVEIGQNTD